MLTKLKSTNKLKSNIFIVCICLNLLISNLSCCFSQTTILLCNNLNSEAICLFQVSLCQCMGSGWVGVSLCHCIIKRLKKTWNKPSVSKYHQQLALLAILCLCAQFSYSLHLDNLRMFSFFLAIFFFSFWKFQFP